MYSSPLQEIWHPLESTSLLISCTPPTARRFVAARCQEGASQAKPIVMAAGLLPARVLR